MAGQTDSRRLLQCFADLLDYPRPGLADVARECDALARAGDPAAAELLRAFRTFVEGTPLSRLEEVYTGTFDLDATYHPYVGYHLFGDSYKRSVFLLRLKECYRADAYSIGNELPDHLAVLLRFLAMSEDSELVEEIMRDAMLPALDRMTGKAKSAGYDEDEPSPPPDAQSERSPYRGVLEALRLALAEAVSCQPSAVSGSGVM